MRWPALYLWVRRLSFLGRYARGRPHDSDYYAFAGTPVDGLFLDVGANSGQSALSFRTQNRQMPVLSVEANPYHEPDLRFLRSWLPRFDYRIVGAGERRETRRLHVPVFRGVPLTGEASLVEIGNADLSWWSQRHLREGQTAEFEFKDVQVELVPLDELRLSPTIVKLDVEGFELSALRGLRETLDRCRPLLLVEASEDMAPMSQFLSEWGYRPRSYDASARRFRAYDGNGTNVFYVSDESPPTRESGGTT